MKHDKGTICLERNNIEGLEILSYVPLYMYNELSQVCCIKPSEKEESSSIKRVDTYKIYSYNLVQSYNVKVLLFIHTVYTILFLQFKCLLAFFIKL